MSALHTSLLFVAALRLGGAVERDPQEVFVESCRSCNWRNPCADGYTCSDLDGGTCQIKECNTNADCGSGDRNTFPPPTTTVQCQRIGCYIADDAKASRFCSVTDEVDYCSIECNTDDTPVCGLDGITYDCEAALRCAGVSYMYSGRCDRYQTFKHAICQPCVIDQTTMDSKCPLADYTCELKDGIGNGLCYYRECESNDDCPTTSVCYEESCCNGDQRYLNHPPNSICLSMSDYSWQFYCPAVYDPVCGFNQITYGNSCQARGTCVHYKGECREPCIKPADPTTTPPNNGGGSGSGGGNSDEGSDEDTSSSSDQQTNVAGGSGGSKWNP